MIKVCIAGCTGWTSGAVAKALLNSSDFELVSAVARNAAGHDIGEVLGMGPKGVKIVATLEEALRQPVDIMIEYTSALAVKEHVMTALKKKIRVVVGATGMTEADFAELEKMAVKQDTGIIAAANFSITAALAKKCALLAAEHVSSWELFDYAESSRPYAPAGTTRELAEALAKVQKNHIEVPIEKVIGQKEARGAAVAGSQIHSVRLPGYKFSFETIFGLDGERLSIRHDAGDSAEPYVAGTLLAAKRVMTLTGMIRGMDTLLFGKGTV